MDRNFLSVIGIFFGVIFLLFGGLAMMAPVESECPPVFKDGEMVKQRLSAREYIVLTSAEKKNFEGLCLVTARGQDGTLSYLAIPELKKAN